MKSLHQIIEELPQSLVEKIKKSNDVMELIAMKQKESDPNTRLVIEARIENINYLVT